MLSGVERSGKKEDNSGLKQGSNSVCFERQRLVQEVVGWRLQNRDR
jgi:hypothetical protein